MKLGRILIYVILVVIVGGILGLVIRKSISAAEHLVPVYVAVQQIPVDQVIKSDADLNKFFKQKGLPAAGVPTDAITDPNKLKELVGKYTFTTILKDQPIEQAAFTDASTMRELIRRFGLNFVGMAIPVDQNDMPIDMIHSGDTIDILGTTVTNQIVVSQYVAEDVPVTAVIPDQKKVIVAIPREDAPAVAKHLLEGRNLVRILLDPRPFEAVQVPTQAPTQTPIEGGKENPSVSPSSTLK